MKITVVGATGHTGSKVVELLNSDEIAGMISSKTTDSEFEEAIRHSSAVIDFSRPAAALKAAKICEKYSVPFVCGTTGFSTEEFKTLKSYSKNTPILYASNFSLGIYVMKQLLKICEKSLDDFDISIIDRHHNKKKDSPSGTTLTLAQQLRKTPQIVSLRIGGVVGDHICSFTSDNEEITIEHRSFDKKVFAAGAIKCARWLSSAKPGYYSLEEFMNVQ